jgi:hypothetical protein
MMGTGSRINRAESWQIPSGLFKKLSFRHAAGKMRRFELFFAFT